MSINFVRPVHPGEFLREEYLLPLGISAGALARELRVPRTRIERIVKEEIGVTPDTALRLSPILQHHTRILDEFSDGLGTGGRSARQEGRDRADQGDGSGGLREEGGCGDVDCRIECTVTVIPLVAVIRSP